MHINTVFTLLFIFSMNITTAHSSSAVTLLFPFSLEVDPMEKLLLINFEKDPDSLYIGFEPQVFNDTVNGVGHLVIGWRKDKKIDVYHQRSLHLDPSKYSIAGAGLNEMIAVDMENAFFEVDERGVHIHYAFTDRLGRRVELKVNEHNPRKRKPFGLLAPMGDATTHPPSLPLVLLHDFYFVRKNHTDLQITIDQRPHQLDELPLRMDGERMTFVRYSPRPLIASFNPAFDGQLEELELTIGQAQLERGNTLYELEWDGSTPSVRSVRVQNAIHELSLHFSPSFPCMRSLSVSSVQKGSFRISGHASIGYISGDYTLRSNDGAVHIQLTPSKGWKPAITKFSTRFLFTVAKVFKKWPTTYQWEAHLQPTADGTWHQQSAWQRTGRIIKEKESTVESLLE